MSISRALYEHLQGRRNEFKSGSGGRADIQNREQGLIPSFYICYITILGKSRGADGPPAAPPVPTALTFQQLVGFVALSGDQIYGTAVYILSQTESCFHSKCEQKLSCFDV